MKLKIKKLNDTAIIPARATPGSAGMDLHACIAEPAEILPGQRLAVPAGISIEPDSVDCAVFIFARSGLATRHGIALSNSVGVVDSDYRGEVIVGLINHSDAAYTVSPGERIAQMVVMPVCLPEIVPADDLTGTGRGDGGFGSTGKQ